MKVEVEQFKGKALGTGREVIMPILRVRVDGIASGHVDPKGGPVKFHRAFTDVEKDEIAAKVAEIMGTENQGHLTPPPMPMQSNQDTTEDLLDDDIDT